LNQNLNRKSKLIDSVIKKLHNNTELTIREVNVWCGIWYEELNNLHQLHTKIPKKYCDDYIFMELMDTYFVDLSFNSNVYYKPNFSLSKEIKAEIESKMVEYSDKQTHNIQNGGFDKNLEKKHNEYKINIGFIMCIDKETIELERTILEKYAEDWDDIISKTNHNDQYLQRIGKEARDTRKFLEKSFEKGEFSLENKNHQLKLNLWKTKWIFLIAKEIIEEESTFPIILRLKEKKIMYNFESIIHILNRHFVKWLSIEHFLSTKSYHFSIKPEDIPNLLNYFFEEFDKSQLLGKNEIIHNVPLNFEYRKRKYQIYFKKVQNSATDLRISSFFLIENIKELKKLENYNLVQLNNELGLYVRK